MTFKHFLCVLLLVPVSAQADPRERVVEVLEASTWGWTTVDAVCLQQTRKFNFNSDRTEMQSYISEEDITVTYDVFEISPKSITMQISSESRTDTSGSPVVWDLRMSGEDAFCWHRVDWPWWACTPFLVNCDQEFYGS